MLCALFAGRGGEREGERTRLLPTTPAPRAPLVMATHPHHGQEKKNPRGRKLKEKEGGEGKALLSISLLFRSLPRSLSRQLRGMCEIGRGSKDPEEGERKRGNSSSPSAIRRPITSTVLITNSLEGLEPQRMIMEFLLENKRERKRGEGKKAAIASSSSSSY